MSGNVVDLGERRREKRAAEARPICSEIHDLVDQIVDRAEMYEKAGWHDEAERLLAGLRHARDILEERVGAGEPELDDTRPYHPNILPKRRLPKHVAGRCRAIIDNFISGRPWSGRRREKRAEGENTP